MAQKRMFDKSIIETDKFLNISLSAKALYFLLGMEADDEGFVSPTRVLRLYGGELGDLKNLSDTGLIIPFKTGVVVITDWNENNYLDKARIKPTQYQLEKKQLLTEGKRYVFNKSLTGVQPEEYRIEEKRGAEKRTISSANATDDFERFWKLYPKKLNKQSSLSKWLLITKKVTAEKVITALQAQVENKMFSSDPKYIKAPDVWLNKGCWDDEIISNKVEIIDYTN